MLTTLPMASDLPLQDHLESAPESDRELVSRCHANDRQAFRMLVEAHMQRAYCHAFALTGQHADALDVSQESFARAWHAIHRCDPDRPFYPWFHAILRNQCFNHLRRRKRRRENALEEGFAPLELTEAETPVTRAESGERRQALLKALAALEPESREILMLKEIEDLSYREIAGLLGIPAGTVMSRLYTARKRLRQRMQNDCHELD